MDGKNVGAQVGKLIKNVEIYDDQKRTGCVPLKEKSKKKKLCIKFKILVISYPD